MRMRTVWFLTRLELLRQRSRWIVIGCAVVVVSTVVIAGITGARRTDSVYDRFRAHNRVSSTGVIVAGLSASQIDTIRTLPEIDAAALEYRFPGRVAVRNGLGS